MGEFFQGWRRKAGLVALVMALALLAAWARSHLVEDEVTMPAGGHIAYSVISSPAGIRVTKLCNTQDGSSQMTLVIGFVIISVWFLITPLTLVSAYLLLSNPPKSNQKKIGEPIPEKVV